MGANLLSGAVPKGLPSGLQFLHVDTNLFFGALPADFPKNVWDLRVNGNNGLFGDITQIIPLTMQSLWLGYGANYGTGKIAAQVQ